MNIIRKLIGPKSKYEKSLPYTYEARVCVVEGVDIERTLCSDTICGLVEGLQSEGIESTAVEIVEVHRDGERVIEGQLYTTRDGAWLTGPDLCASFKEHYPGHIHQGSCSFDDRDPKVSGN